MKLPLLLVGASLLLAACQTTVNGRPVEPPVDKDRDFPSPSPVIAEQIDRHLSDVPYLRGRQIVDACAALVRIGPPAIPKLLEATKSEDPTRRAFALNVLGAIGDRRALPTLRAGLRDLDAPVRYEAARSCVRLGDWLAGMPVLIAGLGDDSEYARTLCNEALRRHTGLDFGYLPRAEASDREGAAQKWRDWWAKHEKATLALQS
ncbi:MAG TPA: HEAT repeat domain-containing protein [Planctomycetota bacterium]|nr:HEAT repeat domain-containing protein [Planctomycetota bacterium]